MVGSGEDVVANWDNATTGRTTNKSGGGKRRGGSGAWSPRNCLLVRDFLVPCLDSGCYGDDLQWLNRRRGVFLIRWTHQGSKSFNREGPNVFKDWSILKRKWDEQDPNRLSKAKQRVRAAFRKLPNVRRINDGAAPHRIYRIKDIGAYLKPWKEPKEKKKRKKQRPCSCVPGSPSCKHRGDQHAAASPALAEDEDDDDDDYMAEDYDEMYGDKEVAVAVGSTPPPSSSCSPASSGVWSSLLSLTEAASATEEHEAPPYATSWGPADMEAVQALLSIRHGPHHRQLATVPPPPPQLQPLPPHVEPVPPMAVEVKQEEQSVLTELRAMPNPAVSPEDDASLAPHSVHVFKEQVAAALALAPRPAQSETVTGDSPHMFWADAAPARQGEQTSAAANGGFVPAFGVKPEPGRVYEAGGAAMGGAAGADAPQAGWTNGSSTSSAPSSWRDRNEPMRPDGCWSTR
ncbi:uncharacterized protein LOC144106296 [Amblyomma americanum]